MDSDIEKVDADGEGEVGFCRAISMWMVDYIQPWNMWIWICPLQMSNLGCSACVKICGDDH